MTNNEIFDFKLNIIIDKKNELRNSLESSKISIQDAQIEANYHIGAMQSRYDTFKEEAQYLVVAHEIRVIKLEKMIENCISLEKMLSQKEKMKTVKEGAFFEVKSFSNESYHKFFYVIPSGAGEFIDFSGNSVLCVSEDAPIISKFIGLEIDDEVLDGDLYISFIL